MCPRCLVSDRQATNIRYMAGLVIVGAGPIGTWVAQGALADGAVDRIAAVVDPDARARSELVAATGAPGYASTVDLPRAGEGDAALVAFASAAEKVAPDVIRLVSAGYNVVTTCEGLAWAPRHIWDAMHTSARSDGRTIIVTGANPGFVMDRLPLLLAGATRGITRIHVERRMDTSTRRPSLVAKSGRGLTADQFAEGIASGRVGHKGLDSSARLIARGLEWPYHDVTVTVVPVIVDGTIVGASHSARLAAGDQREIVLELHMAWGVADEVDRIRIDGNPVIVNEFPGGYPVDEGTAAHVVTALRHMHSLSPGFYRPTDIPLRFGAS
jgi:2,4-diaminopentanoate dehydrogenase